MKARYRVGSVLTLGLLWSSQGFAQTSPPAGGQVATGQAAEQKPKPAPPDPHAGHAMPVQKRPADLPPITDEDRRAAFPSVDGHSVHDRAIHTLVLFDQLEWGAGGDGSGFSWDNKGWIGGDLNRFWFRTEGDADDGRVGAAQANGLYGRAIARWWDLVVGVRQDFRPGSPQTWAAIGIQGLAPYWFEIEATAYVGRGGRTQFRFETEYELLLTNRMILQPLVELELHGKSDPARGVGTGLSTVDVGLRIRYEIRREFAPYVGVTWDRKLFGTADLARERGESVGAARLAVGLRTWF
jgi:copper resistance protein B